MIGAENMADRRVPLPARSGYISGNRGKNLGKSSRGVVVAVVSHIQRIGCQPEKNYFTRWQSRSWSAEQGEKEKRKVWQPPLSPPLLVRRKSKSKSRDASTCLGPTQVSVRLAPVQGTMGVASQNSTLPCAIATFPVSLPLSSPGDV